MLRLTSVNDQELYHVLRAGGIAILRTDTLYGIVCDATDESAVERIFRLKGRDGDKSPIVLIHSIDQMFDTVSTTEREYLESVWPGPVSVIMPSENAPAWIHRSNESVAYRLPARDDLRRLLATVGPLIAPSANPQGQTPAMTIDEAVTYFGDQVDAYVDGGVVMDATPSKLFRFTEQGEVQRLR